MRPSAENASRTESCSSRFNHSPCGLENPCLSLRQQIDALDIPERYMATLGWTMTGSDLQRMAALLRFTDVMVNFATTVTLEAAIR